MQRYASSSVHIHDARITTTDDNEERTVKAIPLPKLFGGQDMVVMMTSRFSAGHAFNRKGSTLKEKTEFASFIEISKEIMTLI